MATKDQKIIGNKPIKIKKQKSDFLIAMAFLAVPLLVFTLFVVIPVFQAMYFSLYKWNGLGPLVKFRWFKNFFTIFTHNVFHKAILNNFKIIILSLLTQLPTALILALAIGRGDFKGKVIFRGIFFLPFIIAEVVAGIMWYFLYHPEFGLANSFLSDIFPCLRNIALLSNPKTVFYAIFVVLWWKYFGLYMVIFIAGLQGIPKELEEAAYVDGANNWQLIWKIILPLLRPSIQISIFLSIVGSFQTFDVIWAMGKGDPLNASETMVTYLYKFGFQRSKLGFGSAVAIIIFVICFIFSILYQRFIVKEEKN